MGKVAQILSLSLTNERPLTQIVLVSHACVHIFSRKCVIWLRLQAQAQQLERLHRVYKPTELDLK